LPGINFGTSNQVEFLKSFDFSIEIEKLSKIENSHLNYSFNRGSFLSGDSEILYSFIRLLKPKKIIEIGCGQSSLMIQHAIDFNKEEYLKYECKHYCVEPYPNSWLKEIDAKVIDNKVEDCDLSLFSSLNENDILFIDSSHIIRSR
jgi:tRNA G46 methylase TrmB